MNRAHEMMDDMLKYAERSLSRRGNPTPPEPPRRKVLGWIPQNFPSINVPLYPEYAPGRIPVFDRKEFHEAD